MADNEPLAPAPHLAAAAAQVLSVADAPMVWDVFCRVIDNFGDIGVCWRLCADLARRGHTVRLWVDDGSALDWMAPGARQGQWPGVQVLDWGLASTPAMILPLPPADVWIEGFGCEIATEFIASRAISTRAEAQKPLKPPVWINLEYLSAEPYVERCHGLPSPIMQGPAKGWVKHFYYPGFTAGTGGLLREPSANDDQRQAWLQSQGVSWAGERLVSLFCYEPAALPAALAAWIHAAEPTLLLVTPGRAARATETALGTTASRASPQGNGTTDPSKSQQWGSLSVHYLRPLPQPEFDSLLRYCDLNFVRGEDSLVRAIWAGRPFVWHIYPQDDGAHALKLAALLETMEADTTVRHLHAAWNGLPARTLGLLPETDDSPHPDWSALPLAPWQDQVRRWRARLLEQPDLVSALMSFVLKRR